MTTGLRFSVLGGMRVLADDHLVDLGGPKQRAVLATLVVDPGRAVAPDRMIDLVWGEGTPPSAETSLQAYVSNLRRVLEPHRKPREAPRVLVTRPGGYALTVERSDVDATAFEDAVTAAHQELRRGDAAAAAARLDAALATWAGPPLPELAGTPWVDEVAAHLGQIRAQALEDRFESGLRLGEHDVLVPRIEAAIADEPFRERLRGQLALALYRSGRQRDALGALAAARRTLVDEVGIEPSAELRRLEAAILDQSPELDPLEPQRAAPVPASATTATAAAATDPTGPGAAANTTGTGTGTTAPADGRPFVGREGELALVIEAFAGAAAGAGRPVVISGEPGIGKTRLVEELAASLPETVVAWGRCPEGATRAAYWPLIQIGRQLEGADALDGDLVGDLLPTEGAPLSDDPTADRLALHLSIARLLKTVTRPLVVVVDDLHWADPASLRVIEFVAAELRSSSTLLVVTTRPVPPDAPPALIDCLGELARQPGAVRLDLAGLSEPDVRSWLQGRSTGPTDPAVAELVHDRTAGNPFFVGELVAMLAAEGRLDDADAAQRGPLVPAAVQDVIRRRVGQLPAASQQALTRASVIGRTFDVDILAAVTEAPVLDLLDDLDPGLASGLLEETDLPGRYQFSHALVADTLAAELTAGRRARLHAATAAAIASRRAGDLDAHLAELAHHAFEGIAAGTAELAVEWAVRSARAAAGRLAFEDAVNEWNRALRALDIARPGDRRTRFDLALELGHAHLGTDSVEAAYAALVTAIDLAIELDEPALAGRAASAASLEGLWFAGEIGLANVDIVAALERALAFMDPEPTVERALALGALAENSYWIRPVAELDAMTAEAVDIARVAGDRLAVARSLHKRVQVLWFAETVEPRAEAAADMLEVIDAGPAPPELEAMARFGAASVAWEHGEVLLAEAQLQRARQLAGRVTSPALITQLDFFQAAVHVWFGRLDEAHLAIDDAYELYRRTRRWQADTFRAGFKGIAWMEQGRIDEVRDVLPALLDTPYRPLFVEAGAFALAELGDLDHAADLVGGTLPPLTDSWLLLGVLAAAAHVRVALGDRSGATALRGPLHHHVGRLACVGTGMAFGDIALALACVEHLLGDDRAAAELADISVATVERSGDSPWLARSLLFRADLTGRDADRDRAARIIDDLDLAALRRRL